MGESLIWQPAIYLANKFSLASRVTTTPADTATQGSRKGVGALVPTPPLPLAV